MSENAKSLSDLLGQFSQQKKLEKTASGSKNRSTLETIDGWCDK